MPNYQGKLLYAIFILFHLFINLFIYSFLFPETNNSKWRLLLAQLSPLPVFSVLLWLIMATAAAMVLGYGASYVPVFAGYGGKGGAGQGGRKWYLLVFRFRMYTEGFLEL